jgi:hypothetical protein
VVAGCAGEEGVARSTRIHARRSKGKVKTRSRDANSFPSSASPLLSLSSQSTFIQRRQAPPRCSTVPYSHISSVLVDQLPLSTCCCLTAQTCSPPSPRLCIRTMSTTPTAQPNDKPATPIEPLIRLGRCCLLSLDRGLEEIEGGGLRAERNMGRTVEERSSSSV